MHQLSSEAGTRKPSLVKVYKNSHTGEVIETKGGNHKAPREWKAKFGSDTVESWLTKWCCFEYKQKVFSEPFLVAAAGCITLGGGAGETEWQTWSSGFALCQKGGGSTG